MSEMQGNVALITGATSGIVQATALKFAAEGVKVALVARHQDKLAEQARAIEADGGEAKAIAADVTNEEDIKRVVRETVATFGGIDVLVNAAGIIATGTIETTKLDDWDYMMNINVRAPFYLMHLAMPYLVERQGNVVN
ncbi:MAG: SDR family NAD(P)-dependent oxidoreductase, partial [Anaerolineae bacterium]